jgi:trimethylamine--corrinoid protein Co-methyltransferase
MLPNLCFLSPEEQERVHEASLSVLHDVGVRIHSSRARKILRSAGAVVEESEKIVKIPPEIVDEALRTAPKQFVLGSRNPERDFRMPSIYSGYVLDSGGIFIIDFNTGERRNFVEKDMHELNRVFDRMRLAAILWPPTVSDFPTHSASLREDISSFMSTSLHIQSELHHPGEVPFMIEALSAITGSEDAVRERKLYSVVYCTLAPLVHEEHMCNAFLDLIQWEVPICILPMPCAGSTGPASLYSNIVQSNAEALSSLVLFQMAQPGTPIIFGDASGSTHFQNGVFLEGSPEMVIQTAARGEMARYYGLPNEQAGCLTEAKAPGAQAVMEKVITTLPLVLGGADLVQGPGALETSNTLCLEQVVVDEEIALVCKRLRDGINFSTGKDLQEDIKIVGPGGHFLGEESTLAACRGDEFFSPRLADRSSFEEWKTLGNPDVYTKARERVEEILSSPQPDPLPDGVIGKLEEIMVRADNELKDP